MESSLLLQSIDAGIALRDTDHIRLMSDVSGITEPLASISLGEPVTKSVRKHCAEGTSGSTFQGKRRVEALLRQQRARLDRTQQARLVAAREGLREVLLVSDATLHSCLFAVVANFEQPGLVSWKPNPVEITSLKGSNVSSCRLTKQNPSRILEKGKEMQQDRKRTVPPSLQDSSCSQNG